MTTYACGCVADGDLVAAHCPQHDEPERGATMVEEDMTDEEVHAELERRGIDTSRAFAKVKVALAKARKHAGRCEHCGGMMRHTRLLGMLCTTPSCKGSGGSG